MYPISCLKILLDIHVFSLLMDYSILQTKHPPKNGMVENYHDNTLNLCITTNCSYCCSSNISQVQYEVYPLNYRRFYGLLVLLRSC